VKVGVKVTEKPVIVIGHGVRAAGVEAAKFLSCGMPVISSWQGADLVDNWHPMYFGRPGIYGQRTANRILYEADRIISIGCRLTPWMIGHSGLRPEQSLLMFDIDECETKRFPQAETVIGNLKETTERFNSAGRDHKDWLSLCNSWRTPWVESPAHDDTNGYINSYRFIERLEPLLRSNEIIVTDVGSLMCPVFQALHVKPPQRLITSGGLGEMGCGLPAAIGASFASGNGEVLALIGDGGMMMNLQEMQTIVHHKLPIKIIVFENDGYAMIKGTHKNIKIPYTGVNKASGVSMPDFCHVAESFGIEGLDARSWNDIDRLLPYLFARSGPVMMVVHIDPEQLYAPRLQPTIVDGKIMPPKFSEMSPRIVEADCG